jgi:hypothetical protein
MRPIPQAIRIEIFKKYLEGYPIQEISKLLHVSVGIVYSISKDESKKDESFIYVRELAKLCKKNNLNIYDIIYGIRLDNKIKELGLTCVFFENFLESSNTESFRVEMNLEQFLKEIERIIEFEEKHQIKIDEVTFRTQEKIKELVRLKNEKKILNQKNRELYQINQVNKAEIEEYHKEKPLFLQYKNDKSNSSKFVEWLTYPHLYEEASKIIGQKIDQSALYSRLNSIYREPQKNIEIIKKILFNIN